MPSSEADEKLGAKLTVSVAAASQRSGTNTTRRRFTSDDERDRVKSNMSAVCSQNSSAAAVCDSARTS